MEPDNLLTLPVIPYSKRMIPEAAYLGSIVIRTARLDERVRRQIEELKTAHPEEFTPEKIEAARKLYEARGDK